MIGDKDKLKLIICTIIGLLLECSCFIYFNRGVLSKFIAAFISGNFIEIINHLF